MKMRAFLFLTVCLLVFSLSVFASLVQITDPNGSVNVKGGEYRVYNNVWGASTPQTLEVETTSTYFKVLSTGHNQSGGPPAAYPFILKGRHFGGTATSPNNPLPIRVSNVTSAPTSWTISGTGAAGIWNCAYDNWFVEGTTNRLEMMIWINYKGGCQPAGTKRTTASINGYSWDVWYNGSGVLSYKIVNVQTSVSLDIKNFIDDAVSRGWLNTAWDFGAFEAGFEIWTNGSGLTSNSFSATAYSGTVPTPTASPTASPTATPTASAGGATPTATATASGGGGSTRRFEGENGTGYNEIKTWPSGYSGSGIGVRWSNGAITWSTSFNSGTSTYTVRVNDYSGTVNFSVQLDGVTKGSHSVSAGDKSWKTFSGSLGSVSAGTHTIGVNFTNDSGANDLYLDYLDVTGP